MSRNRPHVTVVGAGIAGLAAATALAERGYPVTIYERAEFAGGNLGSRPPAGGSTGSSVIFDVYPHMYLTWYHNFWALLAGAGVAREQAFRSMRSIRQLRAGEYPRFTALTDMYSPSLVQMCRNLFSGVGTPADLEVFGYGSVDLLAERWQHTTSLQDVSVTGFLGARPYITDGALKAFDAFITRVWAVPSYLASAEDYRVYLSYCTADPLPSFYLPRGNVASVVIDPVVAALRARGVELHLGAGVGAISCDAGRVSSISIERGGTTTTERVQELILAVPPEPLYDLVRTGARGHRAVEFAPELTEACRLRMQAIPIVNLCFKRKLRRIPPEPVGLYDSPLNLAFTDISQTWESDPIFAQRTVLAVTASEPFGLPGTGDEDDGFAILAELARYLEFELGTAWGVSDAIDWERTSYHANSDSKLFVNEIGSDGWRPQERVDGLANLSLAGAHCQNRIGMTTIESAVTAGLEAANAIVDRHGVGAPVEIREPDEVSGLREVTARYLWAPYAAAAKTWTELAGAAGTASARLSKARRLAEHLFTPSR